MKETEAKDQPFPDTFALEDKPLEKSKDEIEYEIKDVPGKLLYNVTDRPPVHLSIFFAFQQALLALSGSLAVSTFVADVACASDFPDIKTDLLSSTLFMNGITTLLMVIFGARLPVFQGAASEYVIPLIAIQLIDKDLCKLPDLGTNSDLSSNFTIGTTTSTLGNTTTFDHLSIRRALAFSKLQQFQGCLILVGILHCLVGVTGTVGFFLRFIGPVTIVPTILLGGIYLSRATTKFVQPHWGIGFIFGLTYVIGQLMNLKKKKIGNQRGFKTPNRKGISNTNRILHELIFKTAATSLVLSLYLGGKKMPCPAWSRRKGFYIYWYPFHQVLSILIGILLGWTVSALMTYSGALTDNRQSSQYLARSDARSGIIANASWFWVPLPNRFGTPSFNVGIAIAFLIGTITSILDSIGDYYACARICSVPPPPRHAVNRGIAVEGFCSLISGIVGCGHATTTYGGNIGALGITKVASRDVFIWVSVIYMVFGVVGKVSAVFISIPLPVLGGAMIVMYGMFNGVVLSNLQSVSLSSTRNLAIIGTALLVGLMIPYWVEAYPNDINTGNDYTTNIIKTVVSNPNLCGGVVACFLDNTVPGTKLERGITAWQESEKEGSHRQYSNGLEVYSPLIPAKWRSFPIMKYVPICPYQPIKSVLDLEQYNTSVENGGTEANSLDVKL